MGGFFGAVSANDCISEAFFGSAVPTIIHT